MQAVRIQSSMGSPAREKHPPSPIEEEIMGDTMKGFFRLQMQASEKQAAPILAITPVSTVVARGGWWYVGSTSRGG